MNLKFIFLCCLYIALFNIQTLAQIGYQVSLLNSATGEPKAFTTVDAQVILTNSSSETIFTTTQSVTSNDFGVISLSIGDDDTFKNMDWNKLPFFISVKIDNILIAKSQILSVPIAEYAKSSGGCLTKEILLKNKWINKEFNNQYLVANNTLSFNDDRWTKIRETQYDTYTDTGIYEIINGKLYIFHDDYTCNIIEFIPTKNALIYGEFLFYSE